MGNAGQPVVTGTNNVIDPGLFGLSPKQAMASQIVSYLQTLYGNDVAQFNLLGNYAGHYTYGQQFKTWADVQTYFANGGSAAANSIFAGKLSLADWKTSASSAYNAELAAYNSDPSRKPLPNPLPGVPPGPGTLAQRDALAVLQQTLDDYGLGSLANWAWGEITNDTPANQIFIDLRKRPEYQARFPGMAARQKAGLPAMSEGQYIATEEGLRASLRGMGHSDALNDPNTFTKFFANDLNPDEVKARGELWHAMTSAPDTTGRIKSLFKQYTGLGDLTDDQVFNALVTNDHQSLQALHKGMTQNGIDVLSMANLQDQMKRAVQTEAATFQAGGGQAGRQGEGNVSREQRQLTA